MIKRFIFYLTLSAILTAWGTGWATDYYITQTEQGDGGGLTYANSDSIATFNAGASPYDDLGGDTVYMCGTINTEVVVPDSGASGAGNEITIRGDYAGYEGSLRSTSTTKSDTGDWGTTTPESLTVTGTDTYVQNVNDNWRLPLASGTFTASGASIRIRIEADATADTPIESMYIGEKAASGDAYDMEPGTIYQFTFNNGVGHETDAGATIGAGTATTWTNALTGFTYDYTKDYIISIGITGMDNIQKWTSTGIDGVNHQASARASAGTADVTWTTPGVTNGNFYVVKEVELTTTLPANTYSTVITSSETNKDVGNLIFNGHTSYGVKVQTFAECDTQGYFYYNPTTETLFMFSASNPGTYYSEIIVATDANCITIDDDYVTIKNLDMRYAGRHGVSCSTGHQNVIVENCEVSYCGGKGTSTYAADGTRLGNGIEFYGNCSNDIARYNYVHHIYDSPITVQAGAGFGAQTVSNISFYYNILKNFHWGIELTFQNNSSNINGIYVYNNTLDNSTYGTDRFGWETSINAHSMMIHECYPTDSTYANIIIKNNIFYGSYGTGDYSDLLYIDNTTGTSPVANITLDNNCYYRPSGNRIAIIDGTNFTTFADYKASALTDEGNSIGTDPTFINAAAGNFHLAVGSPCIDKGVFVDTEVD